MKDRLLKNQIIAGMPDMILQDKLLQERNLDLEKYIDMVPCSRVCCLPGEGHLHYEDGGQQDRIPEIAEVRL